MKLTTKGRFAVTAMIDLALHQHAGPVALATIAERQKISVSYLEQLFGKLRRHDLVSSVRGPGGGYGLAKHPETISVADIIAAVDETVDATNCQSRGDCDNHRPCMTHQLWIGLNQRMVDYLSNSYLNTLVEQQRGTPCAENAKQLKPKPTLKAI